MSNIERLFLMLYLFVFTFVGLFILLSGKIFSLSPNSSLIITEVMPDPTGLDTLNEWIEIKNTSSGNINLKDWQLNGNKLSEAIIKPQEIIILSKDINNVKHLYSSNVNIFYIPLNLYNLGATLELKRGGEISKFIYPKAKEGVSFERLEGSCDIIQLNPNGNSFGKANNICNTQSNTNQIVSEQKLIINKVCPNPLGSFEFLEIKNTSINTVNIYNWILNDTKSSEKLPYIEILPNKIMTFYPKKVTLNNDGDKITISNASRTYSNSLTYSKSKVNQCFTPDSLNTVFPNITIKADSTKTGPIISVKKDTSSSAESKIGYKIELKIPRLFRIQIGI